MSSHKITADDCGASLIILAAILLTYSAIFGLIRLIIRLTINGPFKVDDWAIATATIGFWAGPIWGDIASNEVRTWKDGPTCKPRKLDKYPRGTKINNLLGMSMH
ncbi:hypothetical protein N7456_002520 [Penicillium angulare]|uniref:Uncharacterized protein n=1 Tax=Penicillium angulare TaxID=116970 RepID=A0A9W9KQC3_9EURO|nr:hypothetical protein N7456_002520 [Penicillium angulare]